MNEEIEKIIREIDVLREQLKKYVPLLCKVSVIGSEKEIAEIEAKLQHIRENPRNTALMLLLAAESALYKLQDILYEYKNKSD